jgi:sulfopyruvate decarboxylase TPP-binding subunit
MATREDENRFTGIAVGVPAAVILDAMVGAGVTHVVTVPDTHQRSVLEALEARGHPPVVRATTEDDVLGICAGLWIAGHRPVALIQQLGLFASANALRGLTYDLGLPLAVLAGMYGRDVTEPASASPRSSVRLCRPMLDALGLHTVAVDTPAEAHLVGETIAAAFDLVRTSVVLLGAPTT